MSDFDTFDDFDHLPANHLINELESIKDILDDDDGGDTNALPTDIPLLDDMVIGNLDANARLLNLSRIFEEESAEDSAENPIDQALKPAAPLPAIGPRADIPFPRFKLDTMLTDDEPDPEPEPNPPITPAPLFANPAASPALSPQQKTPTAAARVRPDYSRDVLIQELVDEFVPQIEAALRERLSQLDNAALQQWKDRD